VLLLRLQEKQHRSKLPRRMPCEMITQVAGTLLLAVVSHTRAPINFFFNRVLSQNLLKKTQSFRKQAY
jgi:hypothetical protein